MKLSTMIGATVAATSMMLSANTASAATFLTGPVKVFETYNYNDSDYAEGAYIHLQNTGGSKVTVLSIVGGVAGGNDFVGGTPGGSTSGQKIKAGGVFDFYLGDSEDPTPGSEGSVIVTYDYLGNTYTAKYTDVIGDLDADSVSQIELTASPVESSVPEPASWMMMLMGFGLLGTALRNKRSVRGLLSAA